MAKYFLGSVGYAEAFRIDEHGNRELAFVSKTLTDSGLNISTTKDDIRAGQGAPIQFSFYHDPSVEINLTDVLWDKNYLTAQLGAQFKDTKHQAYKSKTVTFTLSEGVGTATLSDTVYDMPFLKCNDGTNKLVWGAPVGSDDYQLIDYNDGTLTLAGASGDYCVRFLGQDDRATEATIYSLIVPEELFLIITAPIFSGDACAPSKGKAAGHITFEVPRFQLNGSQEFSMNMSSNQTMSLAGIALASPVEDCDADGGKLLRIIEVIDNDPKWQDGIVELIVDEESAKVGETPVVYGEKKNGTVVKIDNTDLTFDPALTGGKFAAGQYKITLNGRTAELSETITIAE